MKLYDIFIKGRYVDSLEGDDWRTVKQIAEKHFGQKVNVKARRTAP